MVTEDEVVFEASQGTYQQTYEQINSILQKTGFNDIVRVTAFQLICITKRPFYVEKVIHTSQGEPRLFIKGAGSKYYAICYKTFTGGTIDAYDTQYFDKQSQELAKVDLSEVQ